MISIRDAISDLDKVEQLRVLTLEGYVAAVRSAAQYAVELDNTITLDHRKFLTQVADELAAAGTPEVLGESRATIRALFRDYRDKASQYLNHLRQELSNTANALQEVFNALNQSEGNHEDRLRHAMKTLRDISTANSMDIVRPVLLSATENIEQSLGELRKQHQMTVSQFLVEIRSLHKRIDSLENAAALDTLTHLFNQPEMEKRIRDADAGSSLVLVKALGIRRAEREFCPDVSAELAGAFAKRLRNSLTGAAVLGRWGEEDFIAIGPPQKSEAVTAAKWIAEHLGGTYSCLQNGKTVRPALKVDVMVVEREPGIDAEAALLQVREYFKG